MPEDSKNLLSLKKNIKFLFKLRNLRVEAKKNTIDSLKTNYFVHWDSLDC